jgi:excisionase family DNA binding protein
MTGTEWLTFPEAAKELHVDVSTFKRLVKRGVFRTLKTPGGQGRIPRRELESGEERLLDAGELGRVLARPARETDRSKAAVEESMRRFFAEEAAHGVIIAHNGETGQ